MAQPGRGQIPGGPGVAVVQPTFSDLKAFLTLTDAQVQSLTQLRQQENTTIRAKSEEIRTKHEALRKLIESNTTDAAAVGRLMLDIEAARKSIHSEAERFQTQAVAVLNDAQKTRLKTLEDASKLQPAIRQAGALGLLNPPEGVGFGPGPLMMRGQAGGFGGIDTPAGFPGRRFGLRE
jgi:hypothetical protein